MTLLVLRVLQGDERTRTWLALGAVVGVGLQAKHLVLFYALALGAACLVTPWRRLLRTRGPWLAAAVAGLLVAPNLVWQAISSWPTWDMTRALSDGNGGVGAALAFLPMQLLVAGPLLAPLWVAGLVRLWRVDSGRYRVLPLAFGLLVVVFAVSGGQFYYAGGVYPLLLAAGAVAVQAWRETGRGALTERRLAAAVVLVSVPSLPIVLPLLPAHVLHSVPLQKVNYDLGEQVGWPGMVRQVADVADALPAAERAGLVVLTANYGEAGAVDLFGPALGLPPAYSGHNSYWSWGPPAADPSGTTVLVGYDLGWGQARWASCSAVTRLSNAAGVDDDEAGAPVLVCRGLRAASWAAFWPSVRHLG